MQTKPPDYSTIADSVLKVNSLLDVTLKIKRISIFLIKNLILVKCNMHTIIKWWIKCWLKVAKLSGMLLSYN